MATEQDAARDRVLAARAELSEQFQVLEASGRAAVDIPARIRRSPAKAAAVAGGVGFLVLKGPQRLFGAARRAIRGGKPEPVPSRMLPGEIEKTLRKLGDDGDKVRGTLERDFATYVKKAEKDRKGLASVVLLAAARPLLARGAKAAGEYLLSPDAEGFSKRLAEVRARVGTEAEAVRDRAASGVSTAQDRAAEGVVNIRERAAEGVGTLRERTAEGVDATRQAAERAKGVAEDRIAAVRRDGATDDQADDGTPTGI
ncbi:MAG: hypothetical protein ACXW4L_08065 [Candidatus Limnocylindrales bacterium]